VVRRDRRARDGCCGRRPMARRWDANMRLLGAGTKQGCGKGPSIETLVGASSRVGRTSASSSLSACARRSLRWFTKLLTGGGAACAADLVLELLVFAVVLVHAVFFVGPPSFVESQAHALRRRSAWPHHH
jgi:hypothetical protein